MIYHYLRKFHDIVNAHAYLPSQPDCFFSFLKKSRKIVEKTALSRNNTLKESFESEGLMEN